MKSLSTSIMLDDSSECCLIENQSYMACPEHVKRSFDTRLKARGLIYLGSAAGVMQYG